MGNILKIDDFTKDSKSKYGLESGGTCYLVKEPFYLEAIIFYEKDESGGVHKLNPSWVRIKTQKDDLISVTNDGCYIELKDYDGYLECRPESISSKESPKFDRFSLKNLQKTGKNLLKCNPMIFDERKNVSITRV